MHPHYDVIEYDIKYAENIKTPNKWEIFTSQYLALSEHLTHSNFSIPINFMIYHQLSWFSHGLSPFSL